jgi:hypothetical protein
VYSFELVLHGGIRQIQPIIHGADGSAFEELEAVRLCKMTKKSAFAKDEHKAASSYALRG